MEEHRQSRHQVSKAQLYSSHPDLDCVSVLTHISGLKIWSIHFKNQT